MINTKKLSLVVIALTIILLAAGVAGAIPRWTVQEPVVDAAAAVSSGINYQGRLAAPNGAALNGTYTMRFIVYDADVGGSSLWDSGNLNIAVANGLFSVKLGVDQGDFNGQAMWLSIIVDGQTLSPRQEILPAPYALSLRPGADIVGDAINQTDAVLAGYAPATGTALYADANNGVGLYGESDDNYGVWGNSDSSWGGYFTSREGHGIRVNTDGTNIYDYGAYITSDTGYGAYVQSENNQGVRAEAGNVSGFNQPIGPVGLVGLGSNRGVYGSSGNGSGVYGNSDANYGMWGQSDTYRGITGRTNRVDNNYGLYTPDNIYSLNINLAGAVMQVMQNGGTQPLSAGDVVVFSGINRLETAVDAPMVQVSKTTVANSTAVAGVVYSRFNIEAIDPSTEMPDDSQANLQAQMEVTPAGSAAPGDYVLVVVQGPAQVKVSELAVNQVQPGDLLTSSAEAGLADKATMVEIEGRPTAAPGTVFAKALESVDGQQEMIYVYVTLQ